MKRYLMLLVSAILSVWAFVLISDKERWGSSFQLGSVSISIWVGAFAIFVLIGALFLYGEFFTECPDWFHVFFVAIVIVAMVLGPYYTDPVRGTANHEEGSQQNTSYRSYHTYYYFFGRSHSSSSTTSAPSISGKNAFAAIVAIVLIVLVIGTFVIPNFWVAVTLALIALYLCLTVAEFLKDESWM